ncbi:MAG TPA: methyltransferase domain-containing protein [Elusimicrobiota bacterium]|nr:methyltransferase domain-containing protein [Elusimicrobiota bacterium]
MDRLSSSDNLLPELHAILNRHPLLLDIGGQKNRNDGGGAWVIVDVRRNADIVVDLNRQTLPFQDNSVDGIYSSHTLEHILPEKQEMVFAEMHRILKPSGMIRLVVPDIARAINAYKNHDSHFLRSTDNPSKLKSLPDLNICRLSAWFFTYSENSSSFLGGHVMAFDDDLLVHYLRQSRFTDIAKMTYGDHSRIFHGKDIERYKNCSLYYEARKPDRGESYR